MSDLTAIDVQSRAQSALSACAVSALRELVVEEHAGALLIRGRVSSFYHKQLAQEFVRAVAGQIEVTNRVRVSESDICVERPCPPPSAQQ